MTLFDVVERLNDRVRQQVGLLWQRHEDEEISVDEFRALASAVITRAAAQARALGDLSVAAQLSRLNRQVEVASGSLDGIEDDHSHALEALQDQEDTQSFENAPAASMGVAGAAVVMAALQDGIQRSMRSARVEYFTRTANPGACEVCEEMAGVTLPADVDMWHHKGCMCVPTIIIHT